MQEELTEAEKPDPGRDRTRRPSLWMRMPPATRLAIVIFFTCLSSYTLLLFVVPRYKGVPRTDGDEPQYLITAQSIVKDGDFDVADNYRREDYREYYENRIETPNVVELPGGRAVSRASPFTSLVILPGFWLFGWRGAAFTMIVISSLTAVFTFLVAEKFAGRGIAAGITLFLALSYPLIFYSRLIYPETAAAFLLMLGVWSSWRMRESPRPRYAVTAGLAAGLLLLFHPKFIALSASLFLLLLVVARDEWKYVAWWLIPVIGSFVFLIVLYRLAYGPDLLTGFSSGGASSSQYFGPNSLWGIPGLYLDRAWGLFIFAPLYLLFPHGLSLQNNRLEWTRWWAFFPVCMAAHTLVMGTFQSWQGGAAPAPRYLIPVVPLFVICIALFSERCRAWPARAAAVALGLLQIVSTVWAFRFMVGTYGLDWRDNVFIEHFLNGNWIKSAVLAVFPLFHPAGVGSVILTVLWLLAFAVTVYFARRYYLEYGGGKLSPIVKIDPMAAGQAEGV